MPIASSCCSAVLRLFLLGQLIFATEATQAARNSRGNTGRSTTISFFFSATGCSFVSIVFFTRSRLGTEGGSFFTISTFVVVVLAGSCFLFFLDEQEDKTKSAAAKNNRERFINL
ncbi:hypothetical protein D3C73_647170 [compost metagenome]